MYLGTEFSPIVDPAVSFRIHAMDVAVIDVKTSRRSWRLIDSPTSDFPYSATCSSRYVDLRYFRMYTCCSFSSFTAQRICSSHTCHLSLPLPYAAGTNNPYSCKTTRTKGGGSHQERLKERHRAPAHPGVEPKGGREGWDPIRGRAKAPKHRGGHGFRYACRFS